MEATWSRYVQNSAFLTYSRYKLIPQELYPVIADKIGLPSKGKILDVGCGNGFFCEVLKEIGGQNITGLDLDEALIQEAQRRASDIDYLIGNANDLPFNDNQFEIVGSHAFLNCLTDPQSALSEMIRVCKPKGTIFAIFPGASMVYENSDLEDGFPNNAKLHQLNRKIQYAYSKTIINGIWPDKWIPSQLLPKLFSKNHLADLKMYPIGYCFSLSDNGIPYEEKKRYIFLKYSSQIEKINNYQKLTTFRQLVPSEDAQECIRLLREKTQWLISTLEENRTWNWYCGVNVLIVAQNEKNKEDNTPR